MDKFNPPSRNSTPVKAGMDNDNSPASADFRRSETKESTSVNPQSFKISGIIVAKDEEKKIRRCLESLNRLDEIIVIDQSSGDRTAAICREYTDKVFVVASKGFCEPDRSVAAAKAKNEWILYLDADEEMSGEIFEEIQRLMSGPLEYDSYYIPRKNIFLGRWIKGSGWYPGYVLRLFKNGSVRFLDDVHTDLVPLRKCGRLKHHIIHYTCEDLGEYILKSNRYTSILAYQAYMRGERINALNLIWKFFILPCVYFSHRLIIRLGIRDGFRGFLIAFFTFQTIFIKHAKLWAMQKERR